MLLRSRTIHPGFFLASLLLTCVRAQYGLEPEGSQQQIKPGSLPEITSLEVMCDKQHMTVQLGFADGFNGLVFSKGQFNNPNCVYVQPYSGRAVYTFQIDYNQCGTKPDLNGKFYENTIIIQYDSQLIEVWDEAKRLRCEWYNDYEKTATKAPVVIADLEVIELNFRGDNVDCWMEIQEGKGPWAGPVTGIVPLGSTLTMVIAINDPNDEFDMRVKECEASDGQGRPIQLSDKDGCVLRPKMISKFMKLKSNDGRSTAMTYAHFHAFKFPDSVYVHLRCKVEICRYGCPDHCQPVGPGGYNGVRRVDAALPVALSLEEPLDNSIDELDNSLYEDTSAYSVNRMGEEMPDAELDEDNHDTQHAHQEQPQSRLVDSSIPLGGDSSVHVKRQLPLAAQLRQFTLQHHQRRLLGNTSRESDSNSLHTLDAALSDAPETDRTRFPWGPRSLKIRRRRFVVDPAGGASAADVGVGSTLQVISQNDLQFDSAALREAGGKIAVFGGRIGEDPALGAVCLPAAGFSALFVLLAMLAVSSALLAGVLCRHSQRQLLLKQQQQQDGTYPSTLPLAQWPVMTFITQRLNSGH